MLKLEKKTNGILGFTIVVIVLVAVIISYVQVLDYYPSFSPFNNWMSELGVGPNKIMLNLVMMLSAIFFAIFFFGLISEFKTKEGNNLMCNLCLIAGLYSLIGLFLIGFFPMDDIGENNIYHGISAMIYWSGSVIFWGLLAFIMKGDPDSNRIQILVTLTFTAWILFLCTFLVPLGESFPIIFQWTAHLFNLFSISILALNMIRN